MIIGAKDSSVYWGSDLKKSNNQHSSATPISEPKNEERMSGGVSY